MSLKVIVHSASNLPDVDVRGHSDPFVVLSFRGREWETSVQEDTLNPTWPPQDATCEWNLGACQLQLDEKLSIKVKDYEKVWFKKLLGQVEIPLRELRENGKEIKKQSFELQDGKHRPTMGTISLDIAYIPPGGVVDRKESKTEDYDKDEEDDEGDHDDSTEDEKLTGKVDKKRSRRRLARKWSDKTKDFQIRVQIFEGRHLPGSNINPLVRVTVAGQRQQTSIERSTDRPVYTDEIFAFNFRSSEAELFDDLITLEVFNATGPFRSNALLGFYKFDIGFVYERKGHSFIRKWIMLSKPSRKKDEDSADPGIKQGLRGGHSPSGFLKVTAVVQGPGDKLPAGIDVPSIDDKDEDIEANCLIPVGVQRHSASFVLKVYQAKDLPQMDAGIVMNFKSFFASLSLRSKSSEEEDVQAKPDFEEERTLVDPYLIFSFSGNQVSTDIKYGNSNPKFKQVLKIPFVFPSMCERLKLQLMDWDQGNRHDFIGTAYLPLSAISGPGKLGEGFLPQFGPCFVNFYGSPREYHRLTLDKYEDLNKGIGEGGAYRGRVLVELKTVPTNGIRRPVREAMAKEDEINVEPFKKRSKFTLFACFHEATMVAVTDEPVEFEVSIGNKGTKFDETVAPSNTTPLKPVHDHSFYHYLPWGREKPCVWIECLWEDISFRIEPLNILNGMREKLEKDLEDLQKGEKKIRSVLEDFSETCRMELGRFQDDIPKLTGQRNSLDTEIHNLRLTDLENLMADAEILSKKPENELNMESVTEEIRNFIKRIRSMAIEPQLSMPDVILWMISGNKRVAYCRVPAHHVLFSETEAACGKFCGKTIELRLKYPGRDAGKSHHEIPALVRLELWLGPAAHQQHWISRKSGEFNVYAETYENEIRERGKRKQGKPVWKPSSNKNWPHYSDVTGSLKLPTESFTEPEGWKFSGDWIESRGNLTIMRQLEGNLTEFLDETYEHQARTFPGGDWKPGNPRYVDSHGDETTIPTDPPTGWIIKTDWSVDMNRAVDDEGWEYSKHRSYWDYGPEEKAFHMSRRRRLIRHRRRDLRVTGKQLVEDPLPTEGWEYAQSLHETFHPEERSKDCLRRRRWLHKIIQSPEPKTESSIKCPVFKVLVKGPKEKESALCVIPRMLVTYQEPIRCQLWVSIYQARGLVAQDDTGMNDPYVRVVFSNQSQVTETLTQTLCATWDQTLIFREVDIFDNQKDLEQNPPSVVMEIFDYDKRVHDFLGRCIFKPKVRLKGNEGPPEPKLAWHKVRRGDQDGGQILAECELFLIERGRPPALPKPRGRVYPVRPRVAPEKQRKAIEILSWGVRNIKGTNLLLDPNLSVEFECNQTILKSDEVIRDVKRCPNFSHPVLERTILELPTNDEYAPPINIRVFDNNTMFGKSLVGLHEIHSLKTFEVQSESVDSESHEENKTQASSEPPTLEFETQEVFDWWSKYDASRAEQEKESSSADKKKIQKERKKSGQKEDSMNHIEKYLAKGYDTLTIYPCKLEEVPQFRGFNDFVTTFPLRKGKTKSAKDDETEVGQFKGAIRIFNDPDSHDQTMATMHLRSKKPISCVVRVYVIRATQLQPKDPDGLADPYLIISLGDTKVNKKENHIPKTLNPAFGSTFEFKAKIPLVKDLKIRVMDFDFPDPDDLIGETVIDLEQRLLSGYHATCGLPKTYFKSGSFAWRDTLTPFQLLAKHCTLTGKELRLDTGKPEIINIGETPYSLSDFENEAPSNQEVGEPLQRLALHVLHKCGLVPEHVETRPLFSKVRPNIEQGKLEMWVDIFSEEDEGFTSSKYDPSKFVEDQTDGRQLFTIIRQPFHTAEEAQEPRDVEKDPKDEELLLKAPVTIDPRKPLKYELRVVIWNTTDVRLEEKSILGEEMTDIFVKVWIVGIDEEQTTSVHERSLDGNGSFNWRMVFRFEYLPIDRKLVVKEKVHRLSRELRQDTKKPFLKVQIWDKDRFTRSDFIGDLQLDLSTLVRPCVDPNHCGTGRDPREHNQFVDLFIQQWITGWWACYDGLLITGKVQMTMEILSEEEAEKNPVGLGQEEPNRYPKLDKPIRPAHSFLWYLAPLKTLRMIIWKNCRSSFFKFLIIFLVILVVFLFVYSVPNYAAKKLMGV